MFMFIIQMVIVMMMIFVLPLPNLVYFLLGDSSDDASVVSQYYNVVNTSRSYVDMGFGYLGTVNIPQTVLQVKTAAPIIATEINVKTKIAIKKAVKKMPPGITTAQLRAQISKLRRATIQKIQLKSISGKSRGYLNNLRRTRRFGGGKK
jgi:hypothetical protein